MPSNSRFHVFERADGDADLSDFAPRARMVGIESHLRGQVEGHRKSGLPARQQVAEALIGLGGAAETGVLPHGPQPSAIHRGVDAAREREFAGVAERSFRVPGAEVAPGVDGLQGDAGERCRLGSGVVQPVVEVSLSIVSVGLVTSDTLRPIGWRSAHAAGGAE